MSRGTDWIGAYSTPKTYSEILAETQELEEETEASDVDESRDTFRTRDD